MSMERAQRFMDALARLEQAGELEPLLALFGPASQVSNLASPHVFSGREGARRFWVEYRDTLGEVRSSFRNVIAAGDRVALEWETRGTSHNGHPVDYEGVSILEWEGEQLVRFFAYFDPHVLGRELALGQAPARSEPPATAPA